MDDKIEVLPLENARGQERVANVPKSEKPKLFAVVSVKHLYNIRFDLSLVPLIILRKKTWLSPHFLYTEKTVRCDRVQGSMGTRHSHIIHNHR